MHLLSLAKRGIFDDQGQQIWEFDWATSGPATKYVNQDFLTCQCQQVAVCGQRDLHSMHLTTARSWWQFLVSLCTLFAFVQMFVFRTGWLGQQRIVDLRRRTHDVAILMSGRVAVSLCVTFLLQMALSYHFWCDIWSPWIDWYKIHGAEKVIDVLVSVLDKIAGTFSYDGIDVKADDVKQALLEEKWFTVNIPPAVVTFAIWINFTVTTLAVAYNLWRHRDIRKQILAAPRDFVFGAGPPPMGYNGPDMSLLVRLGKKNPILAGIKFPGAAILSILFGSVIFSGVLTLVFAFFVGFCFSSYLRAWLWTKIFKTVAQLGAAFVGFKLANKYAETCLLKRTDDRVQFRYPTLFAWYEVLWTLGSFVTGTVISAYRVIIAIIAATIGALFVFKPAFVESNDKIGGMFLSDFLYHTYLANLMLERLYEDARHPVQEDSEDPNERSFALPSTDEENMERKDQVKDLCGCCIRFWGGWLVVTFIIWIGGFVVPKSGGIVKVCSSGEPSNPCTFMCGDTQKEWANVMKGNDCCAALTTPDFTKSVCASGDFPTDGSILCAASKACSSCKYGTIAQNLQAWGQDCGSLTFTSSLRSANNTESKELYQKKVARPLLAELKK